MFVFGKYIIKNGQSLLKQIHLIFISQIIGSVFLIVRIVLFLFECICLKYKSAFFTMPIGHLDIKVLPRTVKKRI